MGADALSAHTAAQFEEIEALTLLGRWAWDVASGAITCSPQLIRLFGLASPDLMPNSHSFLLRVHQADRTRVRASIMRALSTGEPFQFQHRVVRMDHEIRVFRTRGSIVHGEDGTPLQIIGISQDITEQHAADKHARAHLMQMARRALDREARDRGQVVKELREHVTEPLVALGRKLGSSEDGPVLPHVEECVRAINAAGAATLQVIGHLRPSVLEEHGLLAALRAEAMRMGRQAAIPISVSGQEISPRLPPGTETALFRIAQEAIANAAHHAGATLIRISLTGTATHTRLEIQDNGSGFDAITVAGSDAADPRGITLMRERAEALSASFRLSSQPGTGTRITVDYRG